MDIKRGPAGLRRMRMLMEASRPKGPPSKREHLDARQRGFQAYSDLVTELALKWNLAKHPHPLNRILPRCPWCRIERDVLARGHMASLRPPPAWWKRFIAGHRADLDAISKIRGSFSWTRLRVNGPRGTWWVLNAMDADTSKAGEAFSVDAPVLRSLKRRRS